MILFSDQFFNLRDRYIIPLINVKVQPQKYPYGDFKNILISKLVNAQVLTSNKLRLTINKEDFLKGMLVDIEHFYTRMIVQFVDLQRTLNINSRSWSFVTNYYLGFFSITTLFRMLQSGFVFVDSKMAQVLSKVVTVLAGETLQVSPGNYFFKKMSEESNTIDIEFTLKTQGIHEHSWNYLHLLLQEFTNNSKSDEKVILEKLKDIIRIFKPTFISSLRNKINYNASIGLQEIKSQTNISITEDYKRYAKKLLSNTLEDDFSNKTLLANLYNYYFFMLVNKLYSELTQRRNGKSIESLRNEYLKKFNIELPNLN